VVTGWTVSCRAALAARYGALLPRTLLFTALLTGCTAAPPAPDTRTFRTLADFQAGYWDRPLPPQGASAAADSGLQPARCGACHPLQLGDWQTALHSRAYSPGLEGQLVWWESSDYESVRQCLSCHAPLSEQLAKAADPKSGKSTRNAGYNRSLQRQGIACAACHLRGGQGHGPPLRGGATPPPTEGAAHGGSIRTEFFERSEFCAGCHQFEEPAINGKSLQNTLREWEESRYPAEGITCQTCHMPDRRHLWRGIHDSTMTRDGVTIALERGGARQVALRMTNSGTGHRFPTYVTPTISVVLEQLDGAGNPLDGGRTEGTVGRSVRGTDAGWVEDADTRIAPDSSFVLRARLLPGARAVRGIITVFPDGFYDGMFSGLLAGALSDTSRALLTRAKQQTASSAYRIFEEVLRTGD
jgi:hypothetical protein